MKLLLLLLWVHLAWIGCVSSSTSSNTGVPLPEPHTDSARIVIGAEQLDRYLPILKDKRVAIVANQTSLVGKTHLVDTLIRSQVQVIKVFAPEHGFRGNAEAGALIKDGLDSKTGLRIISLYGKNKKPTDEMLRDVDIVIFDIQDVGARFYTYISTMHYVMEACAEHSIPLVILDRPNPNGHYIDGPIREKELASFVGMHPIPIVHGCTVGELAQMINGEHWLQGSDSCSITIIRCINYRHDLAYTLDTAPSPNLSTQEAVLLYPSLCWFEGTCVSVARGTNFPFRAIGFPNATRGEFEFTPRSIPGVADHPIHENKKCVGLDLRSLSVDSIHQLHEIQLDWLISMYQACPEGTTFFTQADFFDKLAGTSALRSQIAQGVSAADIRKSWKSGLEDYRTLRSKYLLYPDK